MTIDSACHYLTALPQPAEAAAAELHVFPNPAGEVLHISLSGVQPGSVRITLTDVLGREVVPAQAVAAAGAAKLNLDISQLPHGLYLLHATTGEQRLCRKVIRE